MRDFYPYHFAFQGESLPGTPSTDTDSAPGEEDPNDPEWTIGEKEPIVKR